MQLDINLSTFPLQIGPHFIDESLNTARYCSFIRHHLWPLCRDAGVERNTFQDTVWFMQDGAPAHTSGRSMGHLRRRFPGRVISKRGDINWPPRSPDLNPLDYFLWGHIKSLVYKSPPENIDEMEQKIRRATEDLTPEMCVRSIENLLKRARCCIAMDGGHFEHILHL